MTDLTLTADDQQVIQQLEHEAKSVTAPVIRQIDKASVHRICSGQVILDLATGVKELVENSLDAGATSVSIHLLQYGAGGIEVSDNGCGISPANYAGLALKHWTSKIRSFVDLDSVSSFGFRGEALSSLCALGKIKVLTRCEGESMATALEYNHEGVMIDKKPGSRTPGTTVTLTDLFSTLPVRHKVFLKNLKKEYGRMCSVVQSYAMVARGVRIQLYNSTNKDSGKTLVINTQGGMDMKQLISDVFGVKQMTTLQEINFTLESTEELQLQKYYKKKSNNEEEKKEQTATAAASSSSSSPAAAASSSSSSPSSTFSPPSSADDSVPFRLVGFLSKLGDPKCGRSAPDRQFFFLNNRPVDLLKFHKLLNELYRQFNAQTNYPVFVLNLLLPTQAYDINLTPNKREILIHNEAVVFALLKKQLTSLLEPSQYTYRVKEITEFGITQHNKKTTQSLSQPDDESNNAGDDEDDAPTFSPQPSPSLFLSPSISLSPFDSSLMDDSTREMSRFLSPDESTPPLSSKKNNSSPVPTASSSSFLSSPSPSSTHTHSVMPSNKRSSPSPPSPFIVNRQTNVDSDSPFIKRDISYTLEEIPKTKEIKKENQENERANSFLTPNRPQSTSSAAPILPLINPALKALASSSSSPSFSSPPPSSSSSSSPSPAPLTAVRSANSFLFSAVRGVSSATPVNSSSSLDVAAASPSSSATKRQRVDSLIDSSPAPLSFSLSRQTTLPLDQSDTQPLDGMDEDDIIFDATPSNLQPIELSSESPLVASSSPPIDSSSPSPSPSPPVAVCDDTDVDVNYVRQTVQRQMEWNMEQIENYYQHNNQLDEKEQVSDSSSSVLDRLSTLFTPTTAIPSSLPSSFLGADGSSSSAAPVDSRVLSEDSMKRVIQKEDFLQMEIVGQFNLGFIIAKLKNDLFIIDQHATDEKYRFELLQSTTIINSQPLLHPLSLDLTPAMEITLREHVDVFRKNGFQIDIGRDDDDRDKHDEENTSIDSSFHPTRTRIRVTSLPFSKNLTFGPSDIYELCSLLSDSPGVMVRLPKVTSMFASRACRSAVMIGTSLTHTKMTRIVRHMADMESPWSCPHGRPTMRHLADMIMMGKRGTHAEEEEEEENNSPPLPSHSTHTAAGCAHHTHSH